MSKTKAMPETGGRYTRDPKTGELKRIDGQKQNAEVEKARDAAKSHAAAQTEAKGE